MKAKRGNYPVVSKPVPSYTYGYQYSLHKSSSLEQEIPVVGTAQKSQNFLRCHSGDNRQTETGY